MPDLSKARMEYIQEVQNEVMGVFEDAGLSAPEVLAIACSLLVSASMENKEAPEDTLKEACGWCKQFQRMILGASDVRH